MSASQYAEMARRHLQAHRPRMYRELTADPVRGEAYFLQLGEQVATQMAVVEAQMLERLPPADPGDPQAREVRVRQARAVAEEMVLTELVLVGDEETEEQTDADGAYTGWEPGTGPLFDDPSHLMR
ncbi:MAG: hypothetical protein GEV12_19155 [Micromonosporaceae bacterium]|nr:hypothetical protein [Micromonosporaceae bacterium]